MLASDTVLIYELGWVWWWDVSDRYMVNYVIQCRSSFPRNSRLASPVKAMKRLDVYIDQPSPDKQILYMVSAVRWRPMWEVLGTFFLMFPYLTMQLWFVLVSTESVRLLIKFHFCTYFWHFQIHAPAFKVVNLWSQSVDFVGIMLHT